MIMTRLILNLEEELLYRIGLSKGEKCVINVRSESMARSSDINGNVKYKKDEMGRTYFSKKKISYFLFAIAVFFTVLLSFLCTIPSNVSGNAKIYLNVGIVVFCLLWFVLSIMFGLWYIHLGPTQIIYRNYLGVKKIVKASDIKSFERNSNGLLNIVCADKTKVSFEPEYADSIMLWMSEQSVVTKNTRKKDIFIIRPAKYQRVLSVFCLVVFFSFLILGLLTHNVVVSLIFGLLLIFGIWNFCYHYSKKYTIGNGYIEESSLFKSKKLITYVDISDAEIKQGDNVTYILLYDKKSKRPIIKINIYYENAFLLKELAYKMKWLR